MAKAMGEMALAPGGASARPRIFLRLAPPLRRVAILGSQREQALRSLQDQHYVQAVVGVSLQSREDVEDLVEQARRRHIDEVLVVLNGQDESLLASAIERLAACPVDISVYLGALAEAAAGLVHQPAGGERRPILLVRQPMRGWQADVKRAIDVIGSIVALVLLAPLFMLVALAIKLNSPGPIFFRQVRNGLDQRSFMVWKFRTMQAGNPDTVEQARRSDPRVTRVGAFLRRTSIDELPQLLNILRGEMSLVGPRPHPRVLDERFTDVLRLYKARHRVLPGMTGLAQINGCRGETDTADKMAARLRYDLEYIARWSLWLDVKILVATMCGRFLHSNAY
jgi:putative colanic acid biosynthesis UDP-glucose lipid carrier transferase